MAALVVKNLTKKFKDFTAVNDISFSLEKGEILGLLGPNGAGKTTTIQMLLGVLTPTSGSISYFGKNLSTHREQILEKVNFSTTYTNLPWSLTVKENLTFISYFYDIQDRKKNFDELIETFRLSELLNQRMSELSAGQLTRVNLAKAFINDPDVLLLDEPTASLDPEIAKFIRNFILSKRTNHQLSVIFTSHNMTEVEEICDRILFINNGKIVANDTPENLMKTIDRVNVRMVIDKKKDHKLFEFGRQKNVGVTNEGAEYFIELPEKELVELFSYLGKHEVHFHEISIDKPSLEDYFLLIASRNKNKDL
ncbi:ABC transporter ATP-binding protein [soil metagenome]